MINLSDVEIPLDVKKFLSLGFKFALYPSVDEISIERLLADIESILYGFDESKKNIFRAQITNQITNFLHKPKSNDYLNYLFSKSKKFLKENPNLIITKSDKGNVTVIIPRELYVEKSLEILSDENSYKKLNRDPTSTFQQKANKIVSELKSKKYITDEVAKTLTIYNQNSPKFYGLPKIHKPNLSLRPIISSINSPNSKISLHITNILTNAYNENNEYYVKDTFNFIEFIKEKQLPENYELISLDVISLFSKISFDLVVRSINSRWEDIKKLTNIPRDMFLKVINYIFDSTYCKFNNTFYKQILGTPMGANISPIIAQYVMDDLLNTCIPLLPFNLPFIKKYVDDLICAVPNDKKHIILNIFNSYNKDIQFTMEEEKQNKIPFLDTHVIRDTANNKLLLDWYIKPTSSERFINYHSNHPEKMKINLVLTLKNRIERISHPSFKEKNIFKLYNILIENSYPKNILKKLLYNTRSHDITENNRRSNILPNTTNIKYFSIPNIPNLSSRIINIFKNENNIRISQKINKSVGSLYTKLKDKDEILKKSSVVYSIPCNNCASNYIGQTSRVLKDRITSHKSDIKLNKTTCGLAEHHFKTGHFPNYNGIKILKTENNLSKRLFLEMVEIQKNPNNLNKNKEIQNLSCIYSYILQFNNSKT